MSAVAVAFIVFACAFGGAVFGECLRMVLPESHLDEPSKDVMKLGTGLVATIAALVLGLLVASAKETYDDQKAGLNQISVDLILFDSTLAQYGSETKDERVELHDTVASEIKLLWPTDGSAPATLDSPYTTAVSRTLYHALQELTPQTDMQHRLQERALQLSTELSQARWLLVAEQESDSIPTPFLVVLIFWLTAIFASFGLLARPNPTVVVTLFFSALSVSGAIFLILELATPFSGIIKLSSQPLREALSQFGH